ENPCRVGSRSLIRSPSNSKEKALHSCMVRQWSASEEYRRHHDQSGSAGIYTDNVPCIGRRQPEIGGSASPRRRSDLDLVVQRTRRPHCRFYGGCPQWIRDQNRIAKAAVNPYGREQPGLVKNN